MSLPAPTANNWAVITGASGGIGKELSRELARRGYSVILTARNTEILEALAAEIRERYGVSAEVIPSDLGSPAQAAALGKELAAREIAVLCNNAGTATFGAIKDLDPEYERLQHHLNSTAVQELTLAVLPEMVARGGGGILNVGSAAGNMAVPNNSTYAATKAYVNTFSESLRGELKRDGIHVTLLAPGPIRGEEPAPEDKSIVDKVVPGFLWTSAEGAAKLSLDALAANKRRVVPGILSKAMSLAGTYVPRAITSPIVGWFYSKLAG